MYQDKQATVSEYRYCPSLWTGWQSCFFFLRMDTQCLNPQIPNIKSSLISHIVYIFGIFTFSIWTALPLSSVQLQCFGLHSTCQCLHDSQISHSSIIGSVVVGDCICDLTHGLWHVSWFVATSSAFLHASPLTISYFVLCCTSSFWLRIWEIIDWTKPLRKFSLGNLLWTFFFCCWMISWFLLSDHLYTYSLFYTAFFNHPGVFITQSWLLMWVMYGNMQSKTKQIYVLVHIMALNEFQNSFGYMIINRLLSLCKLLGYESWRCDLGVENAVTSFFLNGFWYGSTSYTLCP